METMKRDRPYAGQPHTDTGERGKQEVRGITMRDLRDCLVRAFHLASSHAGGRYTEATKGVDADVGLASAMYEIDLEKVDPGAVANCLTCEVERLMGIFPNIPKLELPADATIEDRLAAIGAPVVDMKDIPAALADLQTGGDGRVNEN